MIALISAGISIIFSLIGRGFDALFYKIPFSERGFSQVTDVEKNESLKSSDDVEIISDNNTTKEIEMSDDNSLIKDVESIPDSTNTTKEIDDNNVMKEIEVPDEDKVIKEVEVEVPENSKVSE